jgi:hypothetical protein
MFIFKKKIYNPRVIKIIAEIFFLTLYPGFFFYHFFVAVKIVKPVLAGFFLPISGIALFVLSIFYIPMLVKEKIPKEVKLFHFILVYSVAIAVLNWAINNPSRYSNQMLSWTLSGVLFNAVNLMLGSILEYRKMATSAMVLLGLMLTVTLLYINEHNMFNPQSISEDSTAVATYQGFARSIVFVGLYLSALFVDQAIKFSLIVAITFSALFLAGARAEFFGYIFSILIIAQLYFWKNKKSLLKLLVTFCGLLILFNFFDGTFSKSRILQIYNLKEASSYQGRVTLNQIALNIIKNNPFLGGYGAYTQFDGVGAYPHNILSAWVNLGIFGFTLYVTLFLMLFKSAYLSLHAFSKNHRFRIFFGFLIYSCFSIIFAKDHSYLMVGMTVGALTNYQISSGKIFDSEKIILMHDCSQS